jgi:hypothetical protein
VRTRAVPREGSVLPIPGKNPLFVPTSAPFLVLHCLKLAPDIARRSDGVLRTPTGAATPGSEAHGRGRQRIFHKLEKDCPPQYHLKLNTVQGAQLRNVRVALLLLCVVQLVVALTILYATAVTHYLHDPFAELFCEAVASLCAFAACAGFVGVRASSRPMLLVLYVNQLWSLSNVSTYAVIQLTSEEQDATACRLFRTGELSKQQACAASPPTHRAHSQTPRLLRTPASHHMHRVMSARA